MGLVNGALQIGRSALESYQSALQVVGNNISNAGNADYTRQTLGLSHIPGASTTEGFQPGSGVAMTGLKRNLDESLENRIRTGIGDRESSIIRQQNIGRVEAFFDEISGEGISSRLIDFFGNFSNVQNDPSSIGLRDIAISSGAELASSLGRLRSNLKSLGDELDERIASEVTEGDRVASQIAELNSEIAAAEAGGEAGANALRDQRDALLRNLAELFDVTVRNQSDGSINVYVGNEPLIQGGVSRGLTTDQAVTGDFVRTSVRFADDDSPVQVLGGRLEGLIAARDIDAYGRLDELDELTSAVIFEVNRIHADGQGLDGLRSVTGTYAVNDPDAALNSQQAGMTFLPKNGSFFIAVADDPTRTPVAYQIDVDLDGIGTDASLNSLVEDINANVDGVTASVTPENRLSIVADAGFSFSFGHDGGDFREDTSDVLAALGVNSFFNGSTAADITVNQALVDSPNALAAATAFIQGDGSNAGRLAEVGEMLSDQLGGLSINDQYVRIVNSVATAGANALDNVSSTDAVLSALQVQKGAISGVSLDEEAVALLKFERAYQGAARYISVVDELLNELMALVR